MHPAIGVLNLLQAMIFAGGAVNLGGAWLPAGVVLGLGAVGQLVAAGALFARADLKFVRWGAIASLLAAAFALGLYFQVGVHLVRHFTPIGAEQAWMVMGGVALATPWFVFFPLWQVSNAKPGRVAGAGTALGVLLAMAVPPGVAVKAAASTAAYAEVDGVMLSRWIHNRVVGGDPWLFPEGDQPVKLVVSLLHEGQVLGSQVLEGPNMSETLRQVKLHNRDRRVNVWVDVVVAESPVWRPWLADGNVFWGRPAESVAVIAGDPVPSYVVWAPERVRRANAAPGVFLPAARLDGLSEHPVTGMMEVRSFVADHQGPVALVQGWRTPDPLTADTAREAALAGARHLLRNMSKEGRFAYVVQSPAGTHGPGYNYPRHAGGAWFLARVAARTGDEHVKAGALRAVEHLGRVSVTADGERAYVLDPTRKDGKAWVGTTALAALAALELGDPTGIGAAWARQVAHAVDERGEVRGDMDLASAAWPAQDRVTYAQGQGLLALAAAQRAGVPGVEAAFHRAADWVESGAYLPRPGARLFTLDEHWMCLAALASEEVRGTPSGTWICDSYLQQQARAVPVPGMPFAPSAGAAGGVAEAWVARAALAQRRGESPEPWLDASLRHATNLLANQYRREDGRRLARPNRLIGGFRDRPWMLDVRVDAVQHIGCALLGVESLLNGRRLPGGMP